MLTITTLKVIGSKCTGVVRNTVTTAGTTTELMLIVRISGMLVT